MKQKLIIGILITAMLLASLASPVSAGTQPSPFKANQLNAIANQLNAIDAKIKAVLAVPPDDIMPNPNGLVGMLGATADKLGALYSRLDAVLASPPDDMTTDERVALTDVRDGAQGIVDTVDAVLGSPPDDQRVVDALNDVKAQAEASVELADTYLGTGGPADPIP